MHMSNLLRQLKRIGFTLQESRFDTDGTFLTSDRADIAIYDLGSTYLAHVDTRVLPSTHFGSEGRHLIQRDRLEEFAERIVYVLETSEQPASIDLEEYFDIPEQFSETS